MYLKIKGCLKSNENNYSFESNGNINNNIIKFNDNDILVEIDLDNNKMVRKTSEYILNFIFKKDQKTINSLILKDINQSIDMDLYTVDIININGYFYVNYELNDDELFEFELRYEGDDNEYN